MSSVSPHQDVETIACSLCGDGPLLAGELAQAMFDEFTVPELVRRWLHEHGWHDHPDGGLICGEHPN